MIEQKQKGSCLVDPFLLPTSRHIARLIAALFPLSPATHLLRSAMGRSEQLPSLVAALDTLREKPGASAAIAAAASVLGVIVLVSVGRGKVSEEGTIFCESNRRGNDRSCSLVFVARYRSVPVGADKRRCLPRVE